MTFQYVEHASGDSVSSIRRESESILSRLPVKNITILLDENGTQLTSPELSKKLFSSGKDITFIIGGAYGVSDEVKKNSDVMWSLGKLVYPHQLVRVILSEQIYRAHTIHIGHPYHHQ